MPPFLSSRFAGESSDASIDLAVQVGVEVLVEGHGELDVVEAHEAVSRGEEDRRADQGAGAPLERPPVGDGPDHGADVGVTSGIGLAERDRSGGLSAPVTATLPSSMARPMVSTR